MTDAPFAFTAFDSDEFLRDYWQKKPLLIKNPWKSWRNPLSPDELAGLACESEVESRLITQEPDQWSLQHGPLAGDRFAQLGRVPWTLLVQAVDHHVPEVAALVAPFRFIPNWRIDDVMVSYAVDGGGVGAHFDQYDVFLVQGLGRRRWQIGQLCDETTPLQPHDDLKLLADFEPVDEWVLEPGDILYVPPRIAHRGVAVGDDCMTYSVGFRAPSRSELLAGWTGHVLEGLGDDDRYGDPALRKQANPGEIAAEAIDRLQAMVAERLLDRDSFARWFGEYATAPKNAEIDWSPDRLVTVEEVRSMLADGMPLLRNPASRFAFVQDRPDAIGLFVDGYRFGCDGRSAEFARRLCGEDQLVPDAALASDTDTVELLVELLNEGSLAFAEEY